MDPYKPLSRSVAGRHVIVTGAASGMGRATAHLFAREGAQVAVTDLNLAACEAVVAEIAAAGFSTARAFALNVADHEAIQKVVAEIAASFGGIDILINNAGVSSFCPLDNGADYDAIWDRALAVMLSAHHQHCLDRRARRNARQHALCCCQNRCCGPDPWPRCRFGERRHHCELHLPRANFDGDDREGARGR